jgi:hypothetical protein
MHVIARSRIRLRRLRRSRSAQHPSRPEPVVDFVGSMPDAVAGWSVFDEGVGAPGVVPT